MGSNSEPDKRPALDEARLAALRARGPGDICPYACRPPLGSTRPLPAVIRKQETERIRQLAEKSPYPGPPPT